MRQHGPSSCLVGPNLPARLLRGNGTPAKRKGVCRPVMPAPAAGDPTIRHDLVARVRREIAAGTYDTPERMEAALARMLERYELGDR